MLRQDRATTPELTTQQASRPVEPGMTSPRQKRPETPAWARPWVKDFQLHLRAELKSHHTVTRYTDAASWFTAWATTQDVTELAAVERNHLRGFFVHLAEAGYSRKYVANIGGALLQFWKWYAAEEDVPNLFTEGFRPPQPPKLGDHRPPVIAVEQLAALIHDAEKGRDFTSRRDTAILRLFASTGGRLAELALLPLTAIDEDAREFAVTGKGGKVRIVKYDHKAARALSRYLRVRALHKHAHLPALWLGARRDRGMTPSGIRQMIERRGSALGLRIWPHLFRHTFAHNWLDAGGAEGDLQEIMGWDSAQMLRHYGRAAASARARRAYDRIDVMRGV